MDRTFFVITKVEKVRKSAVHICARLVCIPVKIAYRPLTGLLDAIIARSCLRGCTVPCAVLRRGRAVRPEHAGRKTPPGAGRQRSRLRYSEGGRPMTFVKTREK